MDINIKRLEQQINILSNQYEHCKTVNKARIILSSINSLLELYENVMKKEYKKMTAFEAINPKYYQKYVEYNNHKRNLFISEFIKNREFHYQFISDIINKFKFLEYDSEYINPNYNSNDELEVLFKNYAAQKGLSAYKIYEMFKDDGRIFITNEQACCASTTYDWYNNLEFILLRYSQNTIENLVSLIHEIGHVEDEMDLSSSKRIDYRDKTIFSEVNSLYREKEFYDYLLEKNLYLEEIKSEVLFEPHTLLETLMNVLIYCKIPKNFINTQEFRYQWIKEALKNIEFGVDIFSENYEEIDLYDALIYSYGELLGTYFLENTDKYLEFRKRRYNMYSPKILNDLDITSDDIVKALYKRYDRYMKS